MSTYLVVGVGFIGAHLVSELLRAGHVVVGADNDARGAEARLARRGASGVTVRPLDVSAFAEVSALVRDVAPDCIINTAAVQTAERDPLLMLRVNTLGLTHLLEAVRLNRPCRIVHVSSDVVYAPPMDESTAEGKAVFPRSFYGATKAAAEAMGHNYAWNLGVDFLTLRFTHVFGGGTGGPARAIENLVEAAVERRPAVVDQWNLFWAGRQDFLYVKDAASALVAVSTSATSAVRAMNVSMGVGCTFEEVVGIVRAQLNTDLDVRYDIEPAAAFRGHWPIPHDTSAAQRQFGFKRRFDMAAAVRDYADTVRARAATG